MTAMRFGKKISEKCIYDCKTFKVFKKHMIYFKSIWSRYNVVFYKIYKARV